jgi:hydroxymethylglutaryl-CoA synthase
MHSPFNKLVAKSIGRLLFNEFVENPDEPRFESVQEFRGITLEESIGNKEIERTFTKLAATYYEEKIVPSVMLSKRLGNTYTASVYTSLASLLFTKGTDLVFSLKPFLVSMMGTIQP